MTARLSFFRVILILAISTYGQNLVLPGMPVLSGGAGACSEIKVGISSQRWRVRKGDTFEVRAFLPFQETSRLRFTWAAQNGKVVSGQGSLRAEIKAGSQRTPGYVNASGFVRVELIVEPVDASTPCTVRSEFSMMVGKIRESNFFSEVESVTLSEAQIAASCSEADNRSVRVETVASDPENDPLLYSYAVSTGRIIGNGAKVIWDLSNAEPGLHRLLVGTDDGNGIHGVKSMTVKVLPCAN